MSAQNAMASTEPPHDLHHRREVAFSAAIGAAGVALFAAIAARAGASLLAASLVSLVFMWVFLPCPALAVTRWRTSVRSWTARAPLQRGAMLLTLAAIGPAAYAMVVPFMPDGVVGFLPWRGMLHLAIFELIVLADPLDGAGFTFRPALRDAFVAGVVFLAYAAIAIPVGLAIGFIHWGWHAPDPLHLAALVFQIYFGIALPEELLFRGLLQNALERWWPGGSRRLASLIVASALFGAAHLGHRPAPNWRYGLLAALAGIAYGFVWQRSRRITASALTHCAVDFVWSVAFGG